MKPWYMYFYNKRGNLCAVRFTTDMTETLRAYETKAGWCRQTPFSHQWMRIVRRSRRVECHPLEQRQVPSEILLHDLLME